MNEKNVKFYGQVKSFGYLSVIKIKLIILINKNSINESFFTAIFLSKQA